MEERPFTLDQRDWDTELKGWRNEAAIGNHMRVTKITVNAEPRHESCYKINYAAGIITWCGKGRAPKKITVWFTRVLPEPPEPSHDGTVAVAGGDEPKKPATRYEWLKVLLGSTSGVALIGLLIAKLPDCSGILTEKKNVITGSTSTNARQVKELNGKNRPGQNTKSDDVVERPVSIKNLGVPVSVVDKKNTLRPITRRTPPPAKTEKKHSTIRLRSGQALPAGMPLRSQRLTGN